MRVVNADAAYYVQKTPCKSLQTMEQDKNISTWTPVSKNVVNFPPFLSQCKSCLESRRGAWLNACPATLTPSDNKPTPVCTATSGKGSSSKLYMPPISESGTPECRWSGSVSSNHSCRTDTSWIFTSSHNKRYPNNNTCYYLKLPKIDQGKKGPPSHTTHQHLDLLPNNSQTATSESTRVNYIYLAPITS